MQLKYTDSVSLVLQTKESKKLHTTESKAWQNYMLSLSTYHMPGAVLLRVLNLNSFCLYNQPMGRYNYYISNFPLFTQPDNDCSLDISNSLCSK